MDQHFDATFAYDLRNVYFYPANPEFKISVKAKHASANDQPGNFFLIVCWAILKEICPKNYSADYKKFRRKLQHMLR